MGGPSRRIRSEGCRTRSVTKATCIRAKVSVLDKKAAFAASSNYTAYCVSSLPDPQTKNKIFACFGLPFHFKPRREETQSPTNNGQTEALHDGTAESDKNSEGNLSADAFVVEKDLEKSGEIILLATSVTDSEAGPSGNEVRRFESTRNHGGPGGTHNEQLIYVVSEYWTAGNHSAIKGDNHRLHAIFGSVKDTNDYA